MVSAAKTAIGGDRKSTEKGDKTIKRTKRPNAYTERMEILMLPSLKCRRIRGDMILVYKIMNGLVDIDWTHFFTLTRSEITRGSKHKLFIEYSRTNTRKYTFSNRTVTLWNALSDNTKAAPSLNILKNKLDIYNDAIFEPLMYEYHD